MGEGNSGNPVGRTLKVRLIDPESKMPLLEWSLEPGEYVIGRSPSCDIVVFDPTVSRRHARVFFRDGDWYIEDLGSTNGTYVRGEDIRGRGPIALRGSVELRVGASKLSVEVK